ncbi:MAG: hypothetical protein AAFY59_07415, partial [Pseudomonadota bacterium]
FFAAALSVAPLAAKKSAVREEVLSIMCPLLKLISLPQDLGAAAEFGISGGLNFLHLARPSVELGWPGCQIGWRKGLK